MALDQIAQKALRDAVERERQDARLAEKLVAWCNAVASGNQSLDDTEAVHRQFEVVFGAIQVEIEDSTGEGQDDD